MRQAPAIRFGACASALALVLATASSGFGQQAAVDGLRAATKASPGDANASLALGKALRRAGRFPEAGWELTRGSTLGQSYKEGLGPTFAYELARTRIDQRDLSGALRACDAVGRATALSNACRAEAYLVQNRASESVPLAAAALKAEPTLYEAKVAEGRGAALEGRTSDAEAALRAAASWAGTRPEAHHYLGLLLAAQGSRDAGAAELRRAQAGDPDDPEIAFDLGQVLGSNADGKASYARAIAIRPTYGAAHAELARVSFDLGDTGGAETEASEAIRLDPGLFWGHVVLGRVRNGQKRYDDGKREGETALKLVASAAAAQLVVADALAGKGDIDLAIEAYQRSYSADRTDPTPLVHGAHACLAAGRATTARAFGDKVVADHPKVQAGWIELGEAALAQSDKDRARTAFETALKLDGPADKDVLRNRLASAK